MKLAVYGLGKLGLPLVSVLARSGHEVIGIDVDDQRVDYCQQTRALQLSSGVFMGDEPDLDLDGDIRFQSKEEAADISFVAVPTPSAQDDSFNALYVMDAVQTIVDVNRRVGEQAYYIVIVSTVSPGTCQNLSYSLPHTATLIYNPTFIALGSVVRDLLEPDLLIFGASDPNDVGTVAELWHDATRHLRTKKVLRIHLGSFTEIELLKLSVNCVLATKISLANSLGALFEAYGVDPSAVSVIGSDKRIGSAFMRPGSPISGPCLPRDNRALQRAAAKKGVALQISQATDDADYGLRMKLFSRIIAPGFAVESIGILGMTYKYGIPVTEGSIGEWLRDRLIEHDYSIFIYDNDVVDSDPLENVLSADVVVITHRELEYLIERVPGKVIKIWS